jgi:hypothetical protein
MSKKREIAEVKENMPADGEYGHMMQIALENDSGIEVLERIMDLKIRHENREAEKAYNSAISEFRAECPTIDKTREGHQSKYAGLAETVEEIKTLLHKYGLSYGWTTDNSGESISVTCRISHIGGHSEQTTLSAPPDTSGSKNSIQAVASTVSYLERYTLFAILGLASREMDTDGEMPVKYISETDAEDLKNRLDKCGGDEKKFCKYLGVDTLYNLPASKYDKAVSAIRKKERE